MAEFPSLDEALRGVSAQKLDTECSDDDLKKISKSLTRWPEVSPWLGLTEAEEEEIRARGDRGHSGLKRERLDVLRRWKENQKDKGTYRSLIAAFYQAERLDLVDVVIELLQSLTTSQATPPPPQSPPLPTPQTSSQSALGQYRSHLKETYWYKRNVRVHSVQWPPAPIQKAFSLAMIQQTQIQRGKISDDFVRLTVTGKVDDILHMKTPIKLEDIFKTNQEGRKAVLIEGAPGAGKSTLSWDICKRWGSGELFQEYKVVILVQLRDPEVQAATTLTDLLPAQDRAMAESAASEIAACKGELVLFILDGWDELPPNLQRRSLFHNLVDSKLVNPTLLKSTVIVTSRPISSGELHPLVSSRVEIIGFTPEELRQYFSECLSGDSQAVEALLERVEENPVVGSSCYLPLNAAIIVHLFLSSNQTLPTTVHGIFTSLVLGCLARYQRERLGLEGEAANLESLDSLPRSLKRPFRQLCTLAFSGVMKDRVTFSSTDLKALGISKDVSALGLLQAVPSVVSHKVSVYYNFLHLQIQELLAAYHISYLSGSEQISQFQKLFGKSRFAAVFQFYAGITQFQSKRKYLSKVAYLLPTGPTGIRDVITNMIRGGDKQQVLSVIRCLFEADDPSLCQFVAKQLKGVLDFSITHLEGLDFISTPLSPLDCLSVGYFLSCVCTTTSGEFKVDIKGCSIDDQGCKFLTRGLSRSPIPNTAATAQLNMDLAKNDIHDEGAHYIAEVLRNSSIVRRLDLSHNAIGDAGLKSLAEALTTNSSLVELSLAVTDIHEEGAHYIAHVLRNSSIVRRLDLSNNAIGDAGLKSLAEALTTNSSLVELSLAVTDIHEEGAHYIAHVLRNSSIIRRLNLSHNAIGDAGLKSLAEVLTTNSSLVELEIYSSSLKITEETGPVLREMLQRNSTLEILDLSRNRDVSDTVALFVAEGLKLNSSLRELNLYYCNMSEEGLKSLADALVVNSSLRRLYLSFSSIGDEGVKSLADALVVNDSLEEVWLESMHARNISESGASVLIESLKTNRRLSSLGLPATTMAFNIEAAVNAVRKKNTLIEVQYHS